MHAVDFLEIELECMDLIYWFINTPKPFQVTYTFLQNTSILANVAIEIVKVVAVSQGWKA